MLDPVIDFVVRGWNLFVETGERFDPFMQRLGDVLLLTAFLATVLFVLIYGHYADWRGSRFGNHLIKFMQVVMLALGLGVIRLFFDDPPFFFALRALIFLGVNWVLWWRVWIVLEEQGVVTSERTKRKQRDSRDKSRVAIERLEDDDRLSRQSDSGA